MVKRVELVRMRKRLFAWIAIAALLVGVIDPFRPALAAEISDGQESDGSGLTVYTAQEPGVPYSVTDGQFVAELDAGAMSIADTGSFGTCSWQIPNGIAFDSTSGLLRVDETDLRYINLAVQVNLGSSSYAKNGVTVTLPYDLGIGRTDGTGETGTYCCYYMVSGPGGFVASVDKASNQVVLTNGQALAAGSHESLVVTYKIDCWNIVSDKPVNLTYTVGSVSGTLPGIAIRTDSSLSYRSGYWIHDWFAYAEYSDAYIRTWSKSYEIAFGAKESDFDFDTYVYDIMRVTVSPAGQQPYSISGTFVPGRYQTVDDVLSANSYKIPYGWDGELLGAALVPEDSRSDMQSVVRADVSYVGAEPYSSLPNHDTRTSNQAGITAASSHAWNVYSFYFDRTDLGVMSKMTEPGTDACDEYTLYFLVRYPKNSESIKQSGNSAQSGFTSLDGSVELTHVLADSKAVRSVFTTSRLYLGLVDDTQSDGIVYMAEYAEKYSEIESKSGLSALKAGRNTVLDMVADWTCLNENRPNSNRTPSGEYAPWVLESIVDGVFLSNTGTDGASAVRLGPGDYRIIACGVAIIDDYGTTSMNADGTWNVGWPIVSKDNVINRGDGDVPVSIYGSSDLYGESWELISTIPLSEAYTPYDWLAVSPNLMIDSNKNYVRLKVVYPESKLTTVVRVEYKIELLSAGSNVSKAVQLADDSLSMVNWLGYTAYSQDSYGADNPKPDLCSDRDTVIGDTASVIRNQDESYPYPGYSSTVYPLRADMSVKLLEASEDVGMIVSQALYDKAGELVGAGDTAAGSYSLQTDVNNLGRVLYKVSGFVTDYSTYDATASAVLSRRKADVDAGLDTAWSSQDQRYYVLLPAGLEYVDGSASVYCSQPGLRGYISGITNLKVGMTGIKSKAGLTVAWWQTGGTTNSRLLVDTEMVGNRQLLVFDSHIVYPDGLISDGRAWAAAYLWPGNLNSETPVGVWGLGLAFEAVPTGEKDLLSGTYETLFAHQFLTGRPTDVNTSTVDLSIYGGEWYDSAQSAFGAAGARMDEYILDAGGTNLTAITSVFHNSSGSGGSRAYVQSDAGDAGYSDAARIELADGADRTYSYALTYEVSNGTTSDVVLWDSIENYNRNDVTSEWTGTVKGVDTNGTDAVVYVAMSAFNPDEYVTTGSRAGVTSSILENQQNGWTLADANTDWSKVRSVAIWFKDMTFDASGQTGLSGATVYLMMEAPESIAGMSAGQSVYTAYNEILFSDLHNGTSERATVLTSASSVDLVVASTGYVNFELPSTGGMGTQGYYLAGMTVVCLGAVLLAVRRRKGCLL